MAKKKKHHRTNKKAKPRSRESKNGSMITLVQKEGSTAAMFLGLLFGGVVGFAIKSIKDSKDAPQETRPASAGVKGNSEITLEFTIPDWAVAPLINADYSACNDEDIEKINKFSQSIADKYGNANFMLADDENLDLGFRHRNDIDNLGSNCLMLLLIPTKP